MKGRSPASIPTTKDEPNIVGTNHHACHRNSNCLFDSCIKIREKNCSDCNSKYERENTKQQRFCQKLFNDITTHRSYHLTKSDFLGSVCRFCRREVYKINTREYQNKQRNRSEQPNKPDVTSARDIVNVLRVEMNILYRLQFKRDPLFQFFYIRPTGCYPMWHQIFLYYAAEFFLQRYLISIGCKLNVSGIVCCSPKILFAGPEFKALERYEKIKLNM